jgi:hypothetical protein
MRAYKAVQIPCFETQDIQIFKIPKNWFWFTGYLNFKNPNKIVPL